MKQKEKRNKAIRHEVATYVQIGYPTKVAIRIVAEKYYLAPVTVQDILYRNR